MPRPTRSPRAGHRRVASSLLLASALALAAPPSRAAVPPFVARGEWIEARTAHVTLISDAGRGVALDAARRLERASEVLVRAHPALRDATPPRVRAVLLADPRQVAAYAGDVDSDHAAGFALAGPDGAWIVAAASVPGGGARDDLLAHAYTHAWLRANLAAPPLWLEEGLALVHGQLRDHDTWAELGRTDPGAAAAAARAEPVTLDLLFGIDPAAPAYRVANPLQRAFRAQSWALAQFLMSSSGGRLDRLDAWLARLRAGAPARASFLEVFGEDEYLTLHAESRAFLQQVVFEPVRRFDFDGRLRDLPVRERTLTPAEALTRLGELLLAAGPERLPDAREHLERALALAPASADARAALGYALDLGGRAAEADSAYARALAAAPGDPAPARWAGLGTVARAIAVEAVAPDSAPAVLRRARERFAASLALDPDDPPALAGFGRTFVLDAAPDSAGVRALQRAVALEPGRTEAAFDLDRLRRAAQQHAEAARRPAPPPRAVDARALSAADSAAFERAGALLDRSRFAEAESLYRQVAEWSTDPAARDLARMRATAVRAQRRDREFGAAFARGLDALREGRTREAVTWFERARDASDDRERRLQAGRAIVRARLQEAVRIAREDLDAKRYAAAKARLDEALALPLQDDHRGAVRALRDEVVAQETLERARALVAAGRRAEARTLFESVAAMPVREELRGYARRQAASLPSPSRAR